MISFKLNNLDFSDIILMTETEKSPNVPSIIAIQNM